MFLLRVLLPVLIVAIAFQAPTAAQTPVADGPSIVTTGIGEARAPATSATLQFLVGSSSAYGGGMMSESAVAEPGTPVATGWMMMDSSGQLDEQSLEPLVQALTDAGVEESLIEVTIPAATEAFGYGGPPVGEIWLDIDQLNGLSVTDLVTAVRTEAPAAGLSVLHTGARLSPADCSALLQEARDAAIADASQRAEGLAASLDGTVGALIQASESPYYGSQGQSSCEPALDAMFGPYGPGTLPLYDARSAEVTVYVQVTLTFALGTGA